MLTLRLLDRPLLLGFFLGLVFGIVDLLFTWFQPLSDDSIPALLRFYGPMFFLWAFMSFSLSTPQRSPVDRCHHRLGRSIRHVLHFLRFQSATREPVSRRTDRASRLAKHDAALSNQ